MRQQPFAAAFAAAFLSAGTLAAQAPDTLPDDRLRDSDRAEYIERVEDAGDYRREDTDLDIDVEEPIAPGEYELREIRDPEDLDADTTGMRPKRLGERTEWLMEPQAEPTTEPGEAPVPKR